MNVYPLGCISGCRPCPLIQKIKNRTQSEICLAIFALVITRPTSSSRLSALFFSFIIPPSPPPALFPDYSSPNCLQLITVLLPTPKCSTPPPPAMCKSDSSGLDGQLMKLSPRSSCALISHLTRLTTFGVGRGSEKKIQFI